MQLASTNPCLIDIEGLDDYEYGNTEASCICQNIPKSICKNVEYRVDIPNGTTIDLLGTTEWD